MDERTDYLICVENELYTIKVHKREDGNNACYYKILEDEEIKLYESSAMKLMQRVIHSFSYHIVDFDKEEVRRIVCDLEATAKSLKVSENYVKEQMLLHFDSGIMEAYLENGSADPEKSWL